jgi:hypothetical protein
MQALRPKHIALTLLTVLISLVVYKFATSDERERACGWDNVLRSDLSQEVAKNVSITAINSDVIADFTRLQNWKMICLTAMYIDSPTFPAPIDNPADRIYFSGHIGRSQCGIGRNDDVFILLLTSDDRALFRKLPIPASIAASKRVIADYGNAHRAAGFRQCASPENARASCASIFVEDPSRCLLLFKQRERAE